MAPITPYIYTLSIPREREKSEDNHGLAEKVQVLNLNSCFYTQLLTRNN